MKKVTGQLTVKEAIEQLSTMPHNAIVRFATGIYPLGFSSYRGYYEDLSVGIGTQYNAPTAGEFMDDLFKAIGTTITGYKGGEYIVTEQTVLWAANYGDCGPAIVGFKVSPSGRFVKILTRVDD